MSAPFEQIGTKWAQTGPVKFGGEEYSMRKKATYSLRNDNFVSRGLQRASTKTGVTATLYI